MTRIEVQGQRSLQSSVISRKSGVRCPKSPLAHGGSPMHECRPSGAFFPPSAFRLVLGCRCPMVPWSYCPRVPRSRHTKGERQCTGGAPHLWDITKVLKYHCYGNARQPGPAFRVLRRSFGPREGGRATAPEGGSPAVAPAARRRLGGYGGPATLAARRLAAARYCACPTGNARVSRLLSPEGNSL